MIKAVVLDVDGVLKGSKEGINFPTPHFEVIGALKRIRTNGIPVILCTGNYYRSILDIITLSQLHNPHISDRGALILNPLDNVLLEKNCIKSEAVRDLLEKLLSQHVYVEVYSEQKYYVQKNTVSSFTQKRAAIIQQEPMIVEDLMKDIQLNDVIKINGYANSNEEKELVSSILTSLHNEVVGAWGGNPAIGSTRIVNITKVGISKAHAMDVILRSLHTDPQDALGVGDSMSDWDFMSQCGYVAAMGNAEDELKRKIETKGQSHYFLAPHVDENGILEAFNYFFL